MSLDPITAGPFPSLLTTTFLRTQQRKVVWNPLLQDDSEGPSLIDYSVTQKSRLSPTLLLVAHAESARGISPRAAHRSVLDSLPSHGSCHSMRTAALRRNQRAPPVASWPITISTDRKSTRLNSSHIPLSYSDYCLRP